jgi:hypothetical protein
MILNEEENNLVETLTISEICKRLKIDDYKKIKLKNNILSRNYLVFTKLSNGKMSIRLCDNLTENGNRKGISYASLQKRYQRLIMKELNI